MPHLDELEDVSVTVEHVWAYEWQITEMAYALHVGERVDWEVVPADAPWMGRLLGAAYSVGFEWDRYADTTALRTSLRGRIIEISAVVPTWAYASHQKNRAEKTPVAGATKIHRLGATDARRDVSRARDLVGFVFTLEIPLVNSTTDTVLDVQ